VVIGASYACKVSGAKRHWNCEVLCCLFFRCALVQLAQTEALKFASCRLVQSIYKTASSGASRAGCPSSSAALY
jgi:hypothetical protein